MQYNKVKANMFRKELAALLKKYNAELEAQDHFMGYPECGEDVRMTVSFRGEVIDGEWENYEDLDLARLVTGDDNG